MKLATSLFITLLILFISVPTMVAQEPPGCGLHHKLNALYAQYPGLEADQHELLERSKHYSPSGDREEIYIIPVVFHIIHENGVENISDAQIMDQMAILNRDFRKLNADTSEIMDEFTAIAADTKIEFRLANVDPFGNCTNGIEHIYSHETNNGDDYSKLNQWPRTRYLNVWIVKSMEDGVAGYAYYPSAVSTGLHYADGIIILNNFIGSIGTSSSFNSRALTHEIGHWLGLPHVWGSTNSPGVACGDDGIEDTPETAGHSTCVLIDTDDCNAGIAENVQNYMEYSYCSRMFTLDQQNVMNLTLETPISGRNNLHTEANQTSTGIIGETVLCSPLPDFYANKDVVCPGGTIRYFPSVQRAIVDEYSWYFPGGMPTYSTDISPIVSYDTPGIYPVELTVTNAAGSETINKPSFAHILGDFWKYEGPHNENFENDHFDTDGWYVFNPEDNAVKWDLVDNAGRSGNQCIGLEYFLAEPDPILEPHYYERIGGTKDIVITPSFNLDNTTGAVLSFNYIYATTNGGLFDGEGMQLKISYRKNCSDVWSTLDILNPDELISAGFYATAFYPGNASNWQNYSIGMPAAAYSSNVRFKIEFTAPDFLNNFFIDDFNISGVLSTGENKLDLQTVELYPNPTNGDEGTTLTFYSPTNETMDLTVYDVLGNVVYQETIQTQLGKNAHTILLNAAAVSKGVYNVVLTTEQSRVTKRLILN